MKKFLIFFSYILIIGGFLTCEAQNPTSTPELVQSGDWSYQENDTGITLTEYRGTAAELEIPDELDGKTVTQLGKDLCKDRTGLESVTIPDSVTAIGANAFSGCSHLNKIRLSNNIRKIESETFRYCISLETIDLPFSVTTIGNYAFADCIRLREIILLAVTTVGDSAFDNCRALTNIIDSRKLASIGAFAFRDTAWLDSQTDEFVFAGNAVLIRWNGNTPDVEVPFGTTAIESSFADNLFVESVTLPETVKQIGGSAFKDAVRLRSVNIPDFVTSIGNNAFSGCLSLEAIRLPEGLKMIGNSAFSSCSKLQKLALPSTVTSIASSAFSGCSSLQELVIPPSVTSIQKEMASNCSSLKDVVIPATVTAFGNKVFDGSDNITLQVAYGSEAEKYAVENEIPYTYILQENGDFVYDQTADGIRIVRYTGKLYDVEIPAEIDGIRVTSIGDEAFRNNSNVRRIILPLTVTEIGDRAFSDMEALEYVQLPPNLSAIGSNAFTGSGSLKQIRIPEGLNTIGTDIFDSDEEITICAELDSDAAETLQSMGWTVQMPEACREDADAMSLWGELDTVPVSPEESLPAETEPDISPFGTPTAELPQITIPQTTILEDFELLRLPDDLTALDASLLKTAGKNLIVYIPASVTEISEDILDGRSLTIISETGGAAEAFAREHDVRFLVKFDMLTSGY